MIRQDYLWTHYIAEFINTLTSLAYVAYGIHGIRRAKRHDIGVVSITNSSYFALIGVGLFSGLYVDSRLYDTYDRIGMLTGCSNGLGITQP